MIGFLCKNILSACLIKLNEVFYFFDGGYRSSRNMDSVYEFNPIKYNLANESKAL
jgi:hypothetical protein